jgi:hypothetical protein
MVRAYFFLSFTSYLLLFTFYFLLPTSSFAQQHTVVRSSGTILKIYPDTIDFGRVRVGKHRDSGFQILNNDAVTHELEALDYAKSLDTTEFTADSVKSFPLHYDSTALPAGASVGDTVHFFPTRPGPDTGRIPIYWAGSNPSNTPVFVVLGIGVAPKVVSNGYHFPDVRDSFSSVPATIAIVNTGSDTTAIDSVTVVNPSALADFIVMLDSLPPSGALVAPRRIGYEGGDSTLFFTVQFQPKSLGKKTLIVRIHTVDKDVIYDTITGTSVEPLVLLNAAVVDFGTIMLQPGPAPPASPVDSFVVSNRLGTYQAVLDTLTHSDTAGNFTVQLDRPVTSHETLAAGMSVAGAITFNITQEGDFVDTIYIPNDTRYSIYSSYSGYRSMLIAKAKVRTGPIGNFTAWLDTVRTCDTVRDTVTINNPYPVEVYIDTILLVSDTSGFSYGQKTFAQKISMPPHENYPFKLAYSFPPDSLNGPQALKMILIQRQRDNETLIIDTITASLFRKQQVLTLQAHLPPPGSTGLSAEDISELKLPITIQGPRADVPELNSWTLSLQFSNDLFVPTGIDVTGSLCAPGDPSYSLTPNWDQSTRTYSIVARGTAVSDPAKLANDLLLSVMMQAYVTTDTIVTVTPTFTWANRPCAYNLQSFTLSIPYANDCGDQTIRAFMLHQTPSFILTGSWPNPANESDGVSIGYRAGEPDEVTTTVCNASGDEIGHFETSVSSGSGTITLPEQLIPSSGLALIRLKAVSADGKRTTLQTCKIAVIR